MCAFAAYAANVTKIIEDDFENGKESPSILGGFINTEMAEIVSGDKSVGGDKALRLFCEGKKLNNVVKFPVKNGAVYIYKFDYRVEKLTERNPISLMLADERGAPPKYSGVKTVARVKNLKLSTRDGFKVPKDEKKYTFRINMTQGSEIVIDNLKIYEIIPDETNSYLFSENHDRYDLFFDKSFPGMYESPSSCSFLDPYSPVLDMPREKFFPFIDKWGQYKYSEWPNKIKSESDFAEAQEKEKAFYAKLRKIGGRDKYGALADSCGDFKPTGRFCLDKVEGKWMLRAPNGNLFWAFGLNSVGNVPSVTIVEGRKHFFEDMSNLPGYKFSGKISSPIRGYPEDARPEYFNFGLRTFFWKYGLKNFSEFKAKMKEISDWRIKQWGFTVYGAWTASYVTDNPAHPYIINTDRPKIRSNLLKVTLSPDPSIRKLFRTIPDFYDPRFAEILNKSVQSMAPKLNHELCVGVFVDNEIPWEMKEMYTAEAILTCPETQCAKIAFRDFLKGRYGDISKLNSSWGSKYSDWGAFLSERAFLPKTEASKKDLNDFDLQFHEKYYKMCRDAVKAASPDVLYFGSRFAWRNDNAVAAAAKYCDVVSLNIYRYDLNGYKLPDVLKDKPLAIGEFSISHADYGHFWRGHSSAWSDDDQVALFKNYMKSVLRHPNIVSASWFTYADQPPTARPDGENASFGVVDVCDTPHYGLVKAFRDMSRKMYKVRLSGEK